MFPKTAFIPIVDGETNLTIDVLSLKLLKAWHSNNWTKTYQRNNYLVFLELQIGEVHLDYKLDTLDFMDW